MADLYRKSALEKISSPEQLDKALKVTSPMGWLALIAITIVVLVTIIWSIFGTIPETITAKGIVTAPVGSNAVYSQESGTIVSIAVHEGDEVHYGDVIWTYKIGKEIFQGLSDQVGIVAEVSAKKDDKLTPGTEIIRISPNIVSSQMVVCYVPLAQAKKLVRNNDLSVRITLDALDSQSYGYMAARIENIDAYASSTSGMAKVLGSGNQLEAAFTKDGPVVAVACQLAPDSSGNTASGYYWSNPKGAKVQVTNGSLVTAKFITDELAPITKLFSKLRDLWGD